MTIRHIHTNVQIWICNSKLCKGCHTISLAAGKRDREFALHVNYLRASLMSLKSLTLFLALWLNHAAAQATTPASPRSYVIHAAHMIDGRSDVVQNDVAVIIEGERTVAVMAPTLAVTPGMKIRRRNSRTWCAKECRRWQRSSQRPPSRRSFSIRARILERSRPESWQTS